MDTEVLKVSSNRSVPRMQFIIYVEGTHKILLVISTTFDEILANPTAVLVLHLRKIVRRILVQLFLCF